MNYQAITTRSTIYRDVEALLNSFGLIASDITDQNVKLWSVHKSGELAGVVGVEDSGEIRLLRSLAVPPGHQGTGIAKRLCRLVFDHVEAEGIAEIYLLTDSASTFFEGMGFCEIPRSETPIALRITSQFSTLCPDSAKVMIRRQP